MKITIQWLCVACFLLAAGVGAARADWTSIGGLKLWLKADAGVTQSGGYVSQWADQSGNGNDVTAPTMAPIYQATGLNGHPTINFANNGCLENDASNVVAGGSPRTVFIVGQASSGGGGCYLLRFRRNDDNYINAFFMAPPDKNYTYSGPGGNGYIGGDSISIVKNPFYATFASAGVGSSLQTYINGVNWYDTSKVSDESAGTPGFTIGDSYSGYDWNGVISEVLVYDSALSRTDRMAVEAYLQSKYGLPAAPSQPPVTNGLKLWLDAGKGLSTSVDGQQVIGWADQSGCGNGATNPPTGGPWYKANWRNTYPAINFNNGAYLQNAFTSLVASGSARTTFVVGQAAFNGSWGGGALIQIRTTAPTYENHLLLNTPSSLIVYSDANGVSGFCDPNIYSTVTNPFCATFALPGPGVYPKVYVNGVSEGVGPSGTPVADTGTSGFNIGTAQGFYFNGYIAEMLVYDSDLSATDRKAVESYLRSKYGLPDAPTQPPVTSGLKLWLNAGQGVKSNSDGHVVVWADQSGCGSDVGMTEDTLRPVWSPNAINGNSAISFPQGGCTWLQNNDTNLVAAGSARTMFVVGQGLSAEYASCGGLLGIRLSEPRYVNGFMLSMYVPGTLFVYSDEYEANAMYGTIPYSGLSTVESPFYATFASPGVGSSPIKVYLNGLNQAATGGGIGTEEGGNTGFTVGNAPYPYWIGYWNGTIAEMLVYDSQLSDADRIGVERYLARKYGMRYNTSVGTIITFH